MAAPKLRVLNNKPATIVVGDKQPILLSTTNVLPGQAATGAVPTTSTVTSIEFKDTGVKLTAEPTMHLTDELTLKLKIEVTSLGDQVVLQASPEIKQFKFGTRSAETVLMLHDGETIVLGGLIQDQERKTRSTLPILGDIPYLGKLFDTVTVDVVSTEVIVTITPHIIRDLQLPEHENQVYWSGTEQHYATKQLFAPQAIPASTSFNGSRAPLPTAQGEPVAPLPSNSNGSRSSSMGRLSTTGEPCPEPGQVASQAASLQDTERSTGFALYPTELATSPSREFTIQLFQPAVSSAGMSSATLIYDSVAVELVRVEPVESTLAVRQTPGELSFNLPPVTGGPTKDVVAQLVFRAKAIGDTRLTLESRMGGPFPENVKGGRVSIVHVQ